MIKAQNTCCISISFLNIFFSKIRAECGLEQAMKSAVLEVAKTVLESALEEEVKAELAKLASDRPRRSGYFQRGLDTQYGHMSNLRVPKLRRRNSERE